MSGKHRRFSQRRPAARRRWGPGLTAAAVGATSVSTALVTGTTTTGVVALPVQLAAVVAPANSTAQIFAGTTYYGTDYSTSTYAPPTQVVPFFLGPQGIAQAVSQNSSDPKGVVVVSSGWGAGQTGTALAMLQDQNAGALDNVDLVILDNNSNRAGGGFWTTYSMFAPLLLTSAEPTPNDLDVHVVDVAYEYNVNSDAPTYPINLLADANSLAAYLYGYGGQSTAEVPAEALDPNNPDNMGKHYVMAPDGTYTVTDVPNSNVTYVTFEAERLPLLRPLDSIPGGSVVADALEPTMTVLVNWGYKDNKSIPDDPSQTQPMALLPPLSQSVQAVRALPRSVQDGATAVQSDFSSPGSKLTSQASTLPTQSAFSLPQLGSPKPDLPKPNVPKPDLPKPTSKLNMTGGSKFSPGPSAPGDASPNGGNPVKQVVNNVTSGLGGLADGLHKAAGAAGTTSDSNSDGNEPKSP
jgi:hypothetical protein